MFNAAVFDLHSPGNSLKRNQNALPQLEAEPLPLLIPLCAAVSRVLGTL